MTGLLCTLQPNPILQKEVYTTSTPNADANKTASSGTSSYETISTGTVPNENIETDRFRNWQRITIALMLVGYAGYYLCRADFSVSTPLILKEFHGQSFHGMPVDKAFIGRIASIGTLAYAFGKFVCGSTTDFVGGRRMFLLGMGGAILCTLLFGMGGLPLFTLAWSLNRLLQSAGWVGMVKITSRWFSYSSYGAAMGLISLSYLFGDFFSRVFLGLLINRGMDWRQVFYVSAAVLSVIFITNFFLLKESPAAISEPEPTANPANVFGTDGVVGTAVIEGNEASEGQEKQSSSLADLLLPLLRNPIFWVVCILSFGFTLVRETFQNWTPTYLTEVAHMNKGDAATASSLFPLFGGISVLLVGFLSDRLWKSGRAVIILIGLLLSIPALLLMAYPPAIFGDSPLLTMMLLGGVAFVLIGPYSFLAGAISLDFGGKRGSATAAGWIDGIGYIGGILAGEVVGKMAQQQGWSAAFVFLACVTGLSSLASAVYWWQMRHQI